MSSLQTASDLGGADINCTDHVPFIVTGNKGSLEVSDEPGALADVAPTILDILGLPKPEGECSYEKNSSMALLTG